MSKVKLVTVSGGLSRPSRSAALAAAIARKLASQGSFDIHSVEIADLAAELGGVLSPKGAPPRIAEAIRTIESADALVVSTPVYRGSYTGLFKHLFDLIDYEALIGKPVLLAACGGSDRHALVIDHQLRPLFSFFQSMTLPIGVFANDGDFTNYEVSNEALEARITLAAERSIGHLRPR